METLQSSSNILQGYWPVIAFFVGMVGYFIINLRENSVRIATLEKKMDNMEPVILEVREKLVSIETTLEFIKNK